MTRRHRSASIRPGAAALVLLAVLLQATAAAAQPDQETTGRVVATITTLEGSVQMSGVAVELREGDSGLVIARTLTDNLGQVTFPDVPAGQYVIRASRPGFVERESASFGVRSPDTARVRTT